MTKRDCIFLDEWLQMEGTITCCTCKKRAKEMLWDVTDVTTKLFPDCSLCDHYINKYDLRDKLNEDIDFDG